MICGKKAQQNGMQYIKQFTTLCHLWSIYRDLRKAYVAHNVNKKNFSSIKKINKNKRDVEIYQRCFLLKKHSISLIFEN